jgi:hypothetical protein
VVDGAAERAAHAGAVARAVGVVAAGVGGDGGAVGSVAFWDYVVAVARIRMERRRRDGRFIFAVLLRESG